MKPLTSRLHSLFFPAKQTDYTFTSAITALENQRIARITKAAIFIFATMASTATMILLEASVSLIPWSIALPAMLATLAVWTVFYRLNSPLPHYIRREPTKEDSERYQTVYAVNPGAVAAPTAGLHFTEEMLQELEQKGVSQTKVTLHVGLGTFRPVQSEDIREHQMHAERYVITPEAAAKLNAVSPKSLQICVGTTSCRMLETATTPEGIIQPGEVDTNIFIYPGYTFKYVKSMLTNFHLPGSTLLMLVSAFAGYELMMEAYAKAIKDRFRFYSYGDAMLIL